MPRETAVHDLKCHPEPFWASAAGNKPYEIRTNDRDYQVGDEVVLRCWNPETQGYTGAWIEGRITYLTSGTDWGLPDGLCVFGLTQDVFDAGGEEPQCRELNADWPVGVVPIGEGRTATEISPGLHVVNDSQSIWLDRAGGL